MNEKKIKTKKNLVKWQLKDIFRKTFRVHFREKSKQAKKSRQMATKEF
jgi:hypothetical protein